MLFGPHLESVRAAIDQGFSHIMDHRFLALQQFIDDILVLEDVLFLCWSAKAMFAKSCGDTLDPKDTAKSTEDFIDATAVAQGILSSWWWGYAKMLRALGCGLEHMVALSRSCRCHKQRCVTTNLTSTMEFITYSWRKCKKSAEVTCCGKG